MTCGKVSNYYVGPSYFIKSTHPPAPRSFQYKQEKGRGEGDHRGDWGWDYSSIMEVYVAVMCTYISHEVAIDNTEVEVRLCHIS